MLRTRSFLGLALAAALLAGCGDQSPPLLPTADPEPLLAKGANQGLIRVTFPSEESPGVPAYARIESGHIYIADGWAVIVFYRDPSCVRPDFNLLLFFDVPAAFGCPLTVEGFAVYETEAYPMGAPKVSHTKGTGAVPVWFVPAEVMLAAMADGELFIGELEALGGRLVGYATHFDEMLQPLPHPVFGGGHPNPKLIQTAHGALVDGRRFQYQLTSVDGEVKSIGLRIR
jgi:hypothetical protein